MALDNSVLSTNALNVAAGANLAVVRTAFEEFGEVASVSPLPSDPSFVEVIFFDVRAAARAIQAVGSWSCRPAPQVGTFTVRMLGTTAFKVEDFNGVSGVHQDPDDEESFILEFFDMRDAARYQDSLEEQEFEAETESGEGAVEPPPGLAPPPGFEAAAASSDSSGSQCLSPPPGLAGESTSQDSIGSVNAAAAAQPTEGALQVTISGLPNDILSEAMFEAVLQQAGLDGVIVSFTTSKGKSWGKAVVVVSDAFTAEWCANHFRGRRWNSSGTEVIARISPVAGAKAPEKTAAPGFVGSSGLSAQAAEFQPKNSQETSTKAAGARGAAGTLSAEAPTFVPGALLANGASAATRKHRQGGAATSDTSTEVGDSELDDEKEETRAAAQR
eukprot:TRINITY_DN19234_c0_g2_i1.p1 TRINITY_DN19234_c0_g2~~TRINITY_DN19234_c0_g2_i1.p1  ORF type:complete len:414 (-),score=110.68 TRINITY_DN19234_c0_g2_i1:406-1566(-)